MAGAATGNDSDYYAFLANAADGKADVSSKRLDSVSEAFGSGQLGLAGLRLASATDAVDAYMSGEQRETFDTLYSVYGEDAANSYRESLRSELNKLRTQAIQRQAADYAKDNPIGATAWSLLSGMAYKPIAGANTLIASALGADMDTYDPIHLTSRASDTLSGTVAENLGGVGGFVYSTGVSLAQSLGSVALLGGAGSLATMGLSAGESAYNDAADRDSTHEEALGAGVHAGVAEVLFEKVSLDSFIKLDKPKDKLIFLKNVLKQSGIEANEEICTEIANTITDYWVMGGKSNYELSVQAYMTQGMDETQARQAAMRDACGNIGLVGLGGALSGGASGAIGQSTSFFRDRNDPVMQAAQIAAEREMQEETHAPAEVFPSAPSSLEQNIQNVQEAPKTAPAGVAQEGGRAGRVEPGKGLGRADGANNEGAFGKTIPAIAVSGDGGREAVTATGVDRVADGTVYLNITDESGNTRVESANGMAFEGITGELLTSEAVDRMDARGVRAYLEGYDAQVSTPESYARAFSNVYARAKKGMGYAQVVTGSAVAQNWLTPKAAMAAYEAGYAAYNVEHGIQTGKTAKFQKTVLDGLNRVTGGKIRLTDADIGANGYYNPETREIVISSKADKGAYVYVAVHEMAHKLKAENAEAWSGFQTLVEDALLANGVDVDAAMAHAKELSRKQGRGELSTEAALEEVIANSAASILQDEAVLRDLVSKDRTTMQRVADFLREFLDNLTQAIQNLGRSMSELESWKQMQALKNDHESLRKIYESLTAALEEGNGQERTSADARGQEQQGVDVKFSV